MKAGDKLSVWRNQAERDAEVLAVLDDRMIVEYEMPAGSSQLLVGRVSEFDKYLDNEANYGIHPVSYKACPKKWRKAILEQSGSWIGKGQGQPHNVRRAYSRGRWKRIREIEPVVLEV